MFTPKLDIEGLLSCLKMLTYSLRLLIIVSMAKADSNFGDISSAVATVASDTNCDIQVQQMSCGNHTTSREDCALLSK